MGCRHVLDSNPARVNMQQLSMAKAVGSHLKATLWAAILFLLFLLNLPPGALGETFTISDSNYPYIFVQEPSTIPVIWHRKTFAFRLAHSAAVRISSRCVRCL